ncbi:MAG TPA: CbiQ family ECF transporter T component, partial [Jatrophihabitantaceae bacterium]|nr:CbiQ family ECF transporter T component [Jatrophihabitantaceae bacterium]
SVAPQLVESTQRVLRARRLRGGGHRGVRVLHSVVIPVLHDALDRALLLAAAMDSRGYGRRAKTSTGERRITAMLLVAGLLGLCAGAYGLLGDSDAPAIALPGMLGGAALCVLGLALGSRRVSHSDYRPDPWGWPEWLVVASGIATATVLIVASHLDAAHVTPPIVPLHYPPLPWLPTVGIVLAALPAVVAPRAPAFLGQENPSVAADSHSANAAGDRAEAAA